MPRDSLLPIKVVLARKDIDFVPDKKPGGSDTPFVPVTDEMRSSFVSAVRGVESYFAASFQNDPSLPAVAKVSLRPEATAKSHRPTALFNEDTCPVIGAESPGELLVSVAPVGLKRLSETIRHDKTKKVEVNVSTLTAIAPFRASDAADGVDPDALRAAAMRGEPLRLRLFRHDSPDVNHAIDLSAKSILRASRAKAKALDYGDNVRILQVIDQSGASIDALLSCVGVQGLSLFPDYRLVKSQVTIVGNLDNTHFPAPDPAGEHGVVGVIDSGTDPRNRRLQAWVLDRVPIVAATDQDNEHGSFVAGLVANSRALNHGNQKFPGARSYIIDVVALDKNGEIHEYDLIRVIDLAVRRFRKVRVWNLSLGQETECVDHRFSMLGMKLDSIAKKHNVLFVIAAGNYEGAPLSTWPLRKESPVDDRICPPADSMRNLTVGSLAHISNAATCSPIDSPSPFTRRGPGPHFLIKPELSHYGGNCDADSRCDQSGVLSLDATGHLVESMGTSFACPLVSTLAANLFHELDMPAEQASPSLVKAMLVHSAFINSVPLDSTEVPYRGIGRPSDAADVLHCTQSSATVVIHVPLVERQRFRKEEFPIPPCLKIQKIGLQAEIFMTLAYDPPTDGRFGIEYCRCNMNASLGTVQRVRVDGKRKLRFKRQVHLAPKGITKGLEKRLVSEGFKWSPLKFYYRKFTRGATRRRWQLRLDLLTRSNYVLREPMNAVLLITIRAIDRHLFVYQGLLREMERLRWGATDLQIRSRLRGRPR